MPKALFSNTLRNTSPLLFLAMTSPLTLLLINKLSTIPGLALPVVKIPSLVQFLNVLLATVGIDDSIHTPVPLAAGLVTVTPKRLASPSKSKVIFCSPKLEL